MAVAISEVSTRPDTEEDDADKDTANEDNEEGDEKDDNEGEDASDEADDSDGVDNLHEDDADSDSSASGTGHGDAQDSSGGTPDIQELSVKQRRTSYSPRLKQKMVLITAGRFKGNVKDAIAYFASKNYTVGSTSLRRWKQQHQDGTLLSTARGM